MNKEQLAQAKKVIEMLYEMEKEYDELPLNIRNEVAHDVISQDLGGQLIMVAIRLNKLVEGFDGDTDEGDSVQPTWSTRMAAWGDDDA
jgi:hypothetical protein